MYIHRSKGFTLIELLVVIAIIGVLSSVVLASLNTARSKGNDAAIQSNLSTIQTEAEIYYGNTSNTYGSAAVTCVTGMFSADSTIVKAIAAAEVANGSGTMSCFASATAYAISSPLSSNSSSHWCVDSTGAVGQRATAAAGTACPAS